MRQERILPQVHNTDGTVFEISPKVQGPDGALIVAHPDKMASHAGVVIRHKASGCVLRSDGVGGVEIFTKSDFAARTEEELLNVGSCITCVWVK